MVLKKIVTLILYLIITVGLSAAVSYSGPFYVDNTKVSLKPVFRIEAIHELAIKFLIKDVDGNFSIVSNENNPIRLVQDDDGYAKGDTVIDIDGFISEPVEISIQAGESFKSTKGEEINWKVVDDNSRTLTTSGISAEGDLGSLLKLELNENKNLTKIKEEVHLNLVTVDSVSALSSEDVYTTSFLYVHVQPQGV